MRIVQVIHNPRAGESKYDKAGLLALLKENGFDCRYFSTKQEGWKDFEADQDLLIIAGGDGTVRKVVKVLLKDRLLNRPEQVAVLPLGTANNISRALNQPGDPAGIIRSWAGSRPAPFDVGRIRGIKGHKFFLESIGFGVFPRLIKEMDKNPQDKKPREKSLQKALACLHELILSYKPCKARVLVDGKDFSGRFILAEIMNTPSIGPKLHISPRSDPGDGEFEVVLVDEKDREKFVDYVRGKRRGRENQHVFTRLKGKDIQISWQGNDVHVDDELVEYRRGTTAGVKMKAGLLFFFRK